MKPIVRLLTTVLLLALLALATSSAWGATAANTQIINKATLTYTGGSATASITVTVALVKANAAILIVPPAAGPYAGTDTIQNDTITVTATTNGPDSYTVGVTPGTQTNNGNSGSANIGGSATTTVELGASMTTGTSGVNFLTVPATVFDGGFNTASSVNGLTAGDTIVITIGGTPYTRTIDTVTNSGAGEGTATITLLGGDIPIASAGIPVYEVKTIPVQVKSGTVVDPAQNVSVEVIASVTNDGSNFNTATATNTYTAATVGTGKLLKYVRNVTTPNVGTNPVTFTTDGASNSFYDGGVKASPGEVLEYVVQGSNIHATNSLTAAVISDIIPTTWVTFKPLAYQTGTRDVEYFDGTTANYYVNGAPASLSSLSGSTLNVNVGTGATSSAGGTLAPAATVWIAYRVTVN